MVADGWSFDLGHLDDIESHFNRLPNVKVPQ
jgi:hypothetical protein